MADTNESTQTQAGAATVQVSDFDALLTKQFNPRPIRPSEKSRAQCEPWPSRPWPARR